MAKNIYYSYRKIDSYNLPIRIIIGARGLGKTYGIQRKILNDYEYKGNQFAWLRATQTAVDTLTKDGGISFFSKITTACPHIKDFDIKSSKDGYSTVYVNKAIVGYIMAVSTYYKLKGSAFTTDIKTVVYDEFIPEKIEVRRGDRVREFINTVENILRLRNDVNIYMLANAIDVSNDILSLFGFKITDHGFYINRKKRVVLHFAESGEGFNKAKRESLVGSLLQDTIYEESISNNNFESCEIPLFNKRPKGCTLIEFIHTDTECIRLDIKDNTLFVTRSPFNDLTYPNRRYSHMIEMCGNRLRWLPKEHMQSLKNFHASNRVKFDSSKSRNIFLQILKNK